VGHECTDLPIIYFLDLNLGRGRMSGKEILDKLNNLECTRAVPKVAFTAYAFDSEEIYNIENQGFNS
jgi:CheY-like chemotaxis protein